MSSTFDQVATIIAETCDIPRDTITPESHAIEDLDFDRPGEPLTVDAHVVHDGAGFAVTDAKISVDGKVKCNAILTFRHTPFPNADLRSHMQQMAQQIGFPAQAMS